MKYSGTKIMIGGSEFVFSPLSLGSIESMKDELANLGSEDLVVQAKTAVSIAHASLKRNYSEMTREEVSDMIDLSNFKEIIEAVMNVSQMKASTEGKGGPSGE